MNYKQRWALNFTPAVSTAAVAVVSTVTIGSLEFPNLGSLLLTGEDCEIRLR